MTLNQTNNLSWSISSARFKMIEQQIRPWWVTDKDILEVLTVVRREFFVNEEQIPLAFSDIQLPINHSGEVMMEPKLEARILQAIKPTGKENVLEIGTGSGYMAALLGYFAKHVTSVEINPDLAHFAVTNLNKSKIPNVRVMTGDASKGWHQGAHQSYDLVCVSGGLPQIPQNLKNQLSIGGKLIAFVGTEPLMSVELVTRISHDYFQTKTLFETLVPMLQVPKEELSHFVF